MKITRRTAEQPRTPVSQKQHTAIEERNTAILNFAMVAIIPLLLTLIAGFALSEGRKVNEDRFHERLGALKSENAALKQMIADLGGVFDKADTLFTNFSTTKIDKLQRELSGVESEIGYNDWDRDVKDVVDEFEHYITRVERPLNFEEQEDLNAMLVLVKKWLIEYSEIESKALFIEKLNQKQSQGADISTELEDRIDELEQTLTLKEIEIIQLRGAMGQSSGSAKQKIQEKTSDNTELIQEITSLKMNAEQVNENIVTELEIIRGNILPNLKGQKFLSIRNSEEKIRDLKEKIEVKLNAIERHAGKLN